MLQDVGNLLLWAGNLRRQTVRLITTLARLLYRVPPNFI